tara:strand:+ start:431 stop:589 length:159 start_codon:yes stop_codon:yes gene_type:complete
MISIGDLVHGFYFHRKIGVVVQIDDADEMAFVHFTDGTKCWEPIVNIKKVAE